MTPNKLEFLRDPRSYPDHPKRVDVIETHFAWVFLTDRHAYKMKKAVRQPQMDHRTLESRERSCRAELTLNRRLAPDVYLDVVPLSQMGDGRLVLGSGAQVVDWLVQMRRLPAARMLDRAIEERTVTHGELESVADLLAHFFMRAKREAMSEPEYCNRLLERTLRNAGELSEPDLQLDLTRVELVAQAQRELISRSASLLAPRGAKVVDGHGDLRPEHVYLGPPPCVIDCLEFDRDLRLFDPVEELAFLALECARQRAPEIGRTLLQRYCVSAEDVVPEALVLFYMSQRATTRAKIAAWHVRDPQFPPRPWVTRAHSYLVDALHYGRAALDLLSRPSSSIIDGDGPLPQERSERFSDEHAGDRLAEQGRDG